MSELSTHLRRDFVPLLFADPLQVIKVSRADVWQLEPSAPSDFLWDEGLETRPLHDLKVLLLEPLLCCLGCVFWYCHAGIPIHDLFSMPCLASMSWPWWYTAQPTVPLMQGSCFLVPCFHLHVWRWGWCSWGHRQHSSSSKHGDLSWCQIFGFWSHLTTTLSPSSPLNHWLQTVCTCAFLSRGTLWALQDFSPSRRSVLPVVFLVTMVPDSQLPWDHWQDLPPV